MIHQSNIPPRFPLHFLSSKNTTFGNQLLLPLKEFYPSFLDILDHYHQFTDPFIATFLHFTLLPPTSPNCHFILLEASSLCSTPKNCGSFDHFFTPTLFQSLIPGKLLTVIDTGASMSITPVLSNFTSPIKKPNIDFLDSITDTKTPVQEQGPISWNVKDIIGVQSIIDTIEYWVSSAIIRLFPPQTNTAVNPTVSLYLDKDGVCLT